MATILLVEDDVLVRDIVAVELRDAGYRVIEASGAREALEVLYSGLPFEVLLTDIQMPGRIDGVALARRLRGERTELVIVLASGVAPPCRPDELPGRFFLKPFPIEALLSHLKAALAERSTERSATAAPQRRKSRSLLHLRS